MQEETHRELPVGERRVRNLYEYIPELRTERWLLISSRLRRNGTRYCAGVMDYVTCGGRGCESFVNLGGSTGPGSRPKKDRNRDFCIHAQDAAHNGQRFRCC